MENFQFYSPTKFIFGKDTQHQVGSLVQSRNAKKVLIHYGGGSVVKSGLLQQIQDSLSQSKVKYLVLGGAMPNPRSSLVYEGIDLCKKEGVDFVLAVGGGSAIDSAKAIALGSMYDGDFWDFYDRKAKITKALPVGVVLTIPAAGSEGSTASVITHENGMLKRGTGSDLLRPVFAIINPELTYTLPMYHASAGVVDMMSHIFERYLTKTTAVELTDHMCEGVLKAIIDAARVMVKHPSDYDARATICWAGTIAHNGILGVGRQEDWSTHILEHELSAFYDVSHGAGLAVMFPAFMKYTLHEDVNRYVRLAVQVWNVVNDPTDPYGVALEGIARFERFLKEIGMPLTLQDLGAKKEDIDKLIEKLEHNKGTSFGSFKLLTLEDAKKIYLLASK
ncbi:MAG: iron-containing alcohol dehydrogenase [Candidatus Izemoplasmatales bacterium]|jgi:alcohol dehydrogenase YqhD (iron-dependent ADH family)|nr:iron-containing alcohol dehydrogenase [bacterium]MDZ4197617.1 iron-containing alcohol dehydrogenase [Candidatus Izemoplasmatales bacterium]